MSDEKEIKFTAKKIDESWKEQVEREKGGPKRPTDTGQSSEGKHSAEKKPTLKPFMDLLTSLGFQAMLHLGEIPNPETQQKEPNLAAAKEIIDLLSALKSKTEGNLSPEESEIFQSVLPELQMKFARLL